ncbi:hypothetical protein JW926_04755, partial [Candidatus Sumerlaeota bacterium]|nr:hypothetical protein [Candidatus Sumerlaeota bacterium]
MTGNSVFLLTIISVLFFCGNIFCDTPIPPCPPVIRDFPEVWIGDAEDNYDSGTERIDLNFFRFTNAFNFDDYVIFDPNDPNDVTTDVRWSFMPDAPGLVLVNGKDGITDPYTEAIEPGAQELTDRFNPNRTEAAAADLWDILDSPSGGTPPYPDPVPGEELDTFIMLFASNGSAYSCNYVRVSANLVYGESEQPDMPPYPPYPPWWYYEYDEPYNDGWRKSSEAGDPDTEIGATGIYWGAHGTSGGDTISAGPGAEHASNGFYCIWDAPANDIPYEAGYVYRAKYTLRSSQADVTKVPKIRLLTQCVGTNILAYSGGILLGGANVNRLFAPGAVAETYTAYMEPPMNLAAGGVTNLKPKFEVYAFGSSEFGATVYCDEVVVQRFPTPSKASAAGVIKTYSPTYGWTGWTPQTLTDYGFGTATVSSNATGLYIETPGPKAFNYGRWYTPADSSGVQFTADKLYRCVYTLQSNVSTLGQIRCLNANKSADWTSKLVILPNQTQAHLPAATGTEYSNWYETMP